MCGSKVRVWLVFGVPLPELTSKWLFLEGVLRVVGLLAFSFGFLRWLVFPLQTSEDSGLVFFWFTFGTGPSKPTHTPSGVAFLCPERVAEGSRCRNGVSMSLPDASASVRKWLLCCQVSAICMTCNMLCANRSFYVAACRFAAQAQFFGRSRV